MSSYYLESLFTKYGTDKGIWGYTPAYEKYMGGRRLRVKRVLEIGICGYRDIPNNVVGASLFAWREYFPNATIYGIDNDSRFIFNDQERIKTACINAYDTEALHATLHKFLEDDIGYRGFDLIVDDAVHDPFPQLSLMNDLAPFMAYQGVYAMEDVCPYKVMGSDLNNMIKLMPEELKHVEAFTTHKDERLLVATATRLVK